MAIPNNTNVSPALIAALPNNASFNYDPAQNLVQRTVTGASPAVKQESLPPDGSGRNRPASVAGLPLVWDAGGNLASKDNRQFSYDYRNRLTEVKDSAGATIATYTYDTFNRRIKRTVGSQVRTTIWSDWQPIEEYAGSQLSSRRTYGANLDEIVRLENDLDGDGVLEEKYVPVYDHTGNLVAATGSFGKPVERYVYSPYGVSRTRVDNTAPEVDRVLAKEGGILWLLLSEEISNSALVKALADLALTLSVVGSEEEGLALKDLEPLEIEVTQPVVTSPEEYHRLVITVVGEPPAVGTLVRLKVEPSALQDLFLNELAEAFELTFAWPAGEPILFGESQLVSRIVANTSEITSEEIGDFFEAPDPERNTPVSTIGNVFGFHGLPRDPETGLVYMRNRYYDPELGRFVTTDPLGYVDGPNAYGFAGNDPLNMGDPFGLCLGMNNLPCTDTLWSGVGYVAGVLESGGKMAIAMPAMAYHDAKRGARNLGHVVGAFQQGGLSEARQTVQELHQVERKIAKERLLGMIPLVNTFREGSKIKAVCEQRGAFQCGRQIGKTTFSAGADAAVIYGGVKSAQKATDLSGIIDDAIKGGFDDLAKEMKGPAVSSSKLLPGAAHTGRFGGNWQRASLEETVSRIAGPNRIVETMASGKQIFRNPDTGLQVVYDSAGNYFRVQNPAGRYLDLYGNEIPANVPLVSPRGTTQTGVPRDVRHALTHFLNGD